MNLTMGSVVRRANSACYNRTILASSFCPVCPVFNSVIKLLNRISRYPFVFSLLWIGFAVAIGFLETPLRFQAKSISLVEALSIGHLVFHGLNIVEIVFAIILLVATILGRGDGLGDRVGLNNKGLVLGCIVVILAVQTILLFTVLDQRTLALIRGEDVPKAGYHLIYIVLDVSKLILLVRLTMLQIRSFQIECAKLPATR